MYDAFGSFFSYDQKVWSTLRVLITRPGLLTADYAAGRRVRYLSPFQLFLWLQAITFVAYHQLFNTQAGAPERMSRSLLIIGGVVMLILTLLHLHRRSRLILHLVTSVHLWAFLMVLLLVEYSITPAAVNLLIRMNMLRGTIYLGDFVTNATIVIMSVYTMFTIRTVYEDPIWKAALKTALLVAGVLLFLDRVHLGA